MHQYEQSTGHWTHNGLLLGVGYSGKDDGDGVLGPGEGKNDPDAQGERGIGPIPRGRWIIHGPPFHHPHAGPDVMRLLPLDPKPMEHGEAWETQTFGRDGFLIHGDSVDKPGTASRGCIILPRLVRLAIWSTGDRELEVVR